MKNMLLFCVCAYLTSCSMPRNGFDRGRTYKLSWILNSHNYSMCPEYILDGENLGCDGRKILIELNLGEKDCVAIMITAKSYAYLPYCTDGLFNEWIKNGVTFEYFYEGEKRELHRLSWEGEDESDWPGPLGDAEPTDKTKLIKYNFDNKVLGSGYEGYEKLRALNIPKGSFIQIVYPPARSDYELTFTKIPGGVLYLTRMWKERGIYVEALRFIQIAK